MTISNNQSSDIPPKENIVVIRPSFKKICNDDACQAATFNFLLYSIAWKIKNSKVDYWYGTGKQINEGLDHSWGLSKTSQAVKDIVALGIIEQRRNPIKGWDQTRQYLFGKDQAEKFKELCKENKICLLHIGLPVDLLNLINAFSKNNKCICQKQQMESLNLTNAFVESNGAIPEDTTKGTSEELTEGKGSSAPPTNSPPSVSPNGIPSKPEETVPKITLNETEQAFWTLWCSVSFNKGIPPALNETAYKHISKLAPLITTEEQLDSLIKYDQKKLEAQQGTTVIYLGNLVNSYRDCKQTQPTPSQQALDRPRSGRINMTEQRLAEEAAQKRLESS